MSHFCEIFHCFINPSILDVQSMILSCNVRMTFLVSDETLGVNWKLNCFCNERSPERLKRSKLNAEATLIFVVSCFQFAFVFHFSVSHQSNSLCGFLLLFYTDVFSFPRALVVFPQFFFSTTLMSSTTFFW